MMRAGRTPWVAGRITLASFCWLTTAYAFVTASPFAYAALIKPRVFPLVGAFSDWHGVGLWLWCLLLVATLWHDLRTRNAVRTAALLLVAAAGGLAVFGTFHPILPGLSGGRGSIVVGVLALVPVVWLAGLDFTRSARFLRGQPSPAVEALRGAEGRLLRATAITVLFVTAVYAVAASIAMLGVFEPDLTGFNLAEGAAMSALGHAWIACVGFLSASLLARLVRRTFALQHLVFSLALATALTFLLDRIAGRAIGLDGALEMYAAASLALSIVVTWSAVRLSRFAADDARLIVALDVYFGPTRAASRGQASIAVLTVAPLLAYGAMAVAAHLDWDGLLLESSVIVMWLTAFGAIYRLTGSDAAIRGRSIAVVCLVPLLLRAGVNESVATRHVLERYAVYNPSFRVADVFHETETIPSFDRFLRANTGFTDVMPRPIDIDFVSPLEPAAGTKPDIFLFIVDSLRPDYLGPYNSDVHFTPSIDRFASEGVVFSNAFTRYGGTTMSVPAIWAGSVLLHKQYVMPFHPMNALEKLLDVNNYTRIFNLDSVAAQLFARPEGTIELNHGRVTMDFSFCRMLDELTSRLPGEADRPVFVYSLPQDIHLSRLGARPSSDTTYGHFYTPYAAGIQSMDACFGRFVDNLKRTGRYDRSLIVLTADHGDMLGENRIFGHSYYVYPPVVRVPLIVHLPSSIKSQAPEDLDALRLSTDITPTLYAALGYRPVQANSMMGRAFIGEDEASLRARRRETVVLAASYGAVYGVLGHNGRRLYIADAVNHDDEDYERAIGGAWHKADVDDDTREINQFVIRQHLDQLARAYHVSP